MYPFQNTIALSDSMLGTVPIYSCWRLMGFDMETSYQLWWISICTLNFSISYIITKKWTGDWIIALIVAWMFAFTIFNSVQLNYMQMIVRFMVPVIFYAAYKLVETPSIKYFTIYSLSIVIQFYCAVYTAFFALYFSLMFILVYLWISRSWKNLLFYFKSERWYLSLLIVLVSASALLWLMIPYFEIIPHVGLKRFGEIKFNLPLIQSFVFAHESSLAWGFLHDLVKPHVDNWWLQSTFAGLLPLCVLISSPVLLILHQVKKIKLDILVRTLLICAFLIALLHVRTENGYTLYALIFKLPGINSMRVLNRFMNVELFLLLLAMALMFSKLNRWYVVPLIILTLCDTIVVPNKLVREKKSDLQARKNNCIQLIERKLSSNTHVVAYINPGSSPYITHLDAMLAAQQLGVKTVNGYSSSCPDAYGNFFLQNSRNGLREWITNNKLSEENILIINSR
jgi:hypothetical protein